MLQSEKDERDEMRRSCALNAALNLHKHEPQPDATKLVETARSIEAYLKGERNGQV